MRTSTRCSQSLRSGSVEMTRKYSAIWATRKLNRKCRQDFVESVGDTNDCFRNTSNNEWGRTIWYVARVVNIFVVTPAASCHAERGSFSALRRVKTYLRNNIWGIDQLVSNIMLINIERNTPKQQWLTWIVSLIFSAVAMTALDRYVI